LMRIIEGGRKVLVFEFVFTANPKYA